MVLQVTEEDQLALNLLRNKRNATDDFQIINLIRTDTVEEGSGTTSEPVIVEETTVSNQSAESGSDTETTTAAASTDTESDSAVTTTTSTTTTSTTEAIIDLDESEITNTGTTASSVTQSPSGGSKDIVFSSLVVLIALWL